VSEEVEFVVRAIVIGIGASLVLDLWAVGLKRLFGIHGLSYPMVGRWLGHMRSGRFVHDSIGKAEPVRGEAVIGWGAHFATGILFAALLLGFVGLGWARQPTVLPALILGLATIVIPFFIMQPGMGAGIAASKMPKPGIARLRSLISHAVFGFGLYFSALLAALLLRA
jgi:hypothetical protein